MNAVNRYAATPGARKANDELIVRHAELVKRIAYHLAGRLPPSVEVNDLIQAGMLGLMEAAANWSMNRGASFETYAGIRIRGAMIDALRKLDWAPRSVHRQARAVAAAVREIEQRSGRDARDVEVAEHMGLSLEDYHRALQDAACCQLASLEESPGEECRDDARSEATEPGRQDDRRQAQCDRVVVAPRQERHAESGRK